METAEQVVNNIFCIFYGKHRTQNEYFLFALENCCDRVIKSSGNELNDKKQNPYNKAHKVRNTDFLPQGRFIALCRGQGAVCCQDMETGLLSLT